MTEAEQRIEKALKLAVRYCGIDGSHHKDYALDQVVRALTGCPMVQATAIGSNGQPYTYERQGESEEYVKLVADACTEDGDPEAYSWPVGTPP